MRLSQSHWKLLMQLRTGACPDLGGFLAGDEHIADCPHCGKAGAFGRGGRSIEHLFSCAAAAYVREEIREFAKADELEREEQQAQLEAARDKIPRPKADERQSQDKIDRLKPSPKLLWTNPKLALKYYDAFSAARELGFPVFYARKAFHRNKRRRTLTQRLV